MTPTGHDMKSKSKKRKIFQRTTIHDDDELPVEDCGKLMEKWKELLQDFCGDAEVGGVASDQLLNNDKFKLLTSSCDPEDDLEQFLESIGALECRETSPSVATPSNKAGSDTELHNNNKKNDNNNNDCTKSPQVSEEDVGHFAGANKMRLSKREGDQSNEEKETENKLKLDGPHSLFKNSVVISRFKMAKLKETLIESEQTIRKLLELKKPRSTWEGICGLEVNNIFTETPKQHQEKTSTSPAEVEKEKHKVTNPLDSNNNRPNLPGVLSSDRLSNSFNFRVKNRDRKMAKCEPNKSLEKACKQRLRRPEDEAKMEILIGGSNFDVCDGGRNSNLRTRVISYENFLETENCSGRQHELQSHSKHNFSRGDFNFSNCCNTRNVQSPHSVDAQNKARSFNRRHHNRHSTNTLSLDQPFGEPENLPKEPIGNPDCENPWKNIEGQNNRGKVDYTSSDCSECFSSGGRTRKTKSRSRICEKHMRSVGTTMNTSVHEEPANQPPLKSFNIANGKSLPLGCCRNSFQLRPSCGVASDVTYDEGEGHYSNLNDERMSNDSSGRLGKRNFSQNYEYCCLCDGQCRDSEFVAVVGKEDKVWLEREGLNKYWKEKAVQTDDVFQRNPKNYTLCDQNDLEEGRCDSRTSTTQAKNNNNNQKAICCPPRCQNHLSLENHPTKSSYSSASSTPAEDTKTFAGQTDIIDLIDEVTSEEVTKQARTHSTQNQSKHTTGQHSGLQESSRAFSNSDKNIGLRKQPSRHDEVFSSGQRIVRAIEDELQGIKPYVSKVNRAAVMRLANKEISKISDFLSTFSDNKCNNV